MCVWSSFLSLFFYWRSRSIQRRQGVFQKQDKNIFLRGNIWLAYRLETDLWFVKLVLNFVLFLMCLKAKWQSKSVKKNVWVVCLIWSWKVTWKRTGFLVLPHKIGENLAKFLLFQRGLRLCCFFFFSPKLVYFSHWVNRGSRHRYSQMTTSTVFPFMVRTMSYHPQRFFLETSFSFHRTAAWNCNSFLCKRHTFCFLYPTQCVLWDKRNRGGSRKERRHLWKRKEQRRFREKAAIFLWIWIWIFLCVPLAKK